MTDKTTTADAMQRAATLFKRAKEIDSTAWAFDAEPDAYFDRRIASIHQAQAEMKNAE